MAFGFKRKEHKADLVFTGGKIYTQKADMPWAEAVACLDGKIVAVGSNEEIMSLAEKSTEHINLDGATLLPGYIEYRGSTIADIFSDIYIDVSNCHSLEEVKAILNPYFAEHPDKPAYFAIGLEPTITSAMDREILQTNLDEICNDKPMLFMHKNAYSLAMNTCALREIEADATANEVTFISFAFVVSALHVLDFETMAERIDKVSIEKAKKGFTSIVANATIDYFTSAYQDYLVEKMQEMDLEQRIYSYFFTEFPISPKDIVTKLRQKHTFCVDMNNCINFAGLQLKLIDRTKQKEMCLAIADAGFNIQIEADTREEAIEALETFRSVRYKGYRKNLLTLVGDVELTPSEAADFGVGESVMVAPKFNSKVLDEIHGVHEAVDALTIDAAISLGEQDKLGTIEKGKYADFAIFKKNPLDCATMNQFKAMEAMMTVINGKVVYDGR